MRHRTGIGGIGQLTRSLLDREGDLSNELARGHLTARSAQLRSTLDNAMARAQDGDNMRTDEEEGPAPVPPSCHSPQIRFPSAQDTVLLSFARLQCTVEEGRIASHVILVYRLRMRTSRCWST